MDNIRATNITFGCYVISNGRSAVNRLQNKCSFYSYRGKDLFIDTTAILILPPGLPIRLDLLLL